MKNNLRKKKNSLRPTEHNEEGQESSVKKILIKFCENTSVHGIQYIGQNLYWFERYSHPKFGVKIAKKINLEQFGPFLFAWLYPALPSYLINFPRSSRAVPLAP